MPDPPSLAYDSQWHRMPQKNGKIIRWLYSSVRGFHFPLDSVTILSLSVSKCKFTFADAFIQRKVGGEENNGQKRHGTKLKFNGAILV
jgi:hypothetical protein